ncbi:hypothetical protein PENTCL1PPCAC_23589, partial [Pristionchus entomophagus]
YRMCRVGAHTLSSYMRAVKIFIDFSKSPCCMNQIAQHHKRPPTIISTAVAQMPFKEVACQPKYSPVGLPQEMPMNNRKMKPPQILDGMMNGWEIKNEEM